MDWSPSLSRRYLQGGTFGTLWRVEGGPSCSHDPLLLQTLCIFLVFLFKPFETVRLVCDRRMKLSGWGRYPVLDCRLERIRGWEDVYALLRREETLIARGNGRSYGDASLNPDLTLSMLAMDRMQAFDEKTGLLTCEAGVLLADILDVFVPRGWFPPVVPGTKFVTVGGMIAADVHGKNHHRDGSFGAYVESLLLMTADGETRMCNRAENADLFRATLGGMGLTGVILSASFRLKPIETTFIMEETLATRDLDETMALFETSRHWPYSAAWIDCLARGSKQGRSLLMRGRFLERSALPPLLVSDPLLPTNARLLTVPINAPTVLLNRVLMKGFNAWYYRRGAKSSRTRLIHFDRFSFPSTGYRSGTVCTDGADSYSINAYCRRARVRLASGRYSTGSPRLGPRRFLPSSSYSAQSEKDYYRFRWKAIR